MASSSVVLSAEASLDAAVNEVYDEQKVKDFIWKHLSESSKYFAAEMANTDNYTRRGLDVKEIRIKVNFK